jgi:ribosomal protein RSM22 (predicted rRNA methylase)
MLLRKSSILVEENMAQVKNQQTVVRPPIFERAFASILEIVNPSAMSSSKVMQLSNHYVSKPDSESPWLNPTAIEALLLYYHPLNQARAFGASLRARQTGFFSDLEHLIEIGAGSGAATMGILAAYPLFHFIKLTDISREVLAIAEKILRNSLAGDTSLLFETIDLSSVEIKSIAAAKTLAVFSYVLTEGISTSDLEGFLKKNSQLEAIAIFEPATQEDARKLQALRGLLKRYGYSVWAPCPHNLACPLLAQSDRDWCHDRVPHIKPDWWDDLESQLPIKNPSLAVSYLFARKQNPVLSSKIRVVGDPLYEKTKVRQMFCRGENREFFSWFPSRLGIDEAYFDLARGDLFAATDSLFEQAKGSEPAREFRLNMANIEEIRNSLQTLPTSSSSS